MQAACPATRQFCWLRTGIPVRGAIPEEVMKIGRKRQNAIAGQ